MNVRETLRAYRDQSARAAGTPRAPLRRGDQHSRWNDRRNHDFSSLPTTTLHVVENGNTVEASCRFTDTSGVYELNGEVGSIDSVCTLVTEDGTVYSEGSGHVVAAENLEGGYVGGNAMIQCHFAR